MPEPADARRAALDHHWPYADVVNLSVTELELLYGILDNENRPAHCRFYFREPLPYHLMPAGVREGYFTDPATQPVEAGRLAALKERIRRDPRFEGRWRSYPAAWDESARRVVLPPDFARTLAEDLWDDLDAMTRGKVHRSPGTWQEQEHQELLDFIDRRAHGFLGREGLVAELLEVALGDDGPRVAALQGPPGAGKSSLFAHLCGLLDGRQFAWHVEPKIPEAVHRLREKNVLVLSHAFGISRRSLTAGDVLRRWGGLLAMHLGEPEPGDDLDRDALEQTFERYLRRVAADRRVVLLLDALDQMEPSSQARKMHWLPRSLPANVRLLTTATFADGGGSQALAERYGATPRPVPPLTAAEATDVIDSLCVRVRRKLNSGVRAALIERRDGAGQPACGNPLWIELAVCELFLLAEEDYNRTREEAFRHLDGEGARLVALLVDTVQQMPGDVAGLYQWLLERAELVAGSGLARRFAVLIAASRFGWRETDLRQLLPAAMPDGVWDDLLFRRLRHTFRAHLREFRSRLGGTSTTADRYDFFHQQLREGVRLKYLEQDKDIRDAHWDIACHLSALPEDDPIRVGEIMFHLIGSGEREQAGREYAHALRRRTAGPATAALADHIRAGAKGLAWVCGALQENS